MADTELDILRRKLAARKDMPGFEENRREIEQRIAELEAKQAASR